MRCKTSWTGSVLALLLFWGSTAPAASARIPPLSPPVGMSEEIEGYSVATLFRRWVSWVEQQKGLALESASAEPERPEGLRRRGQTLMEARGRADSGLVVVAEISIFCPDTLSPLRREGCQPRMRELTIPIHAYGGEHDVLAVWAREAFDPAAAVAALKAAGVAPASNLWFVNGATLFAGAPSPAGLLQAAVRTRSTDTVRCPLMGEALAAMEGQMLEWRIDLAGLGEDALPSAPRPHATRWSYMLRFLNNDFVTVEAGASLAAVVSPPFAAGEACMARAR